MDNLLAEHTGNINWRGSASYVTGAHNIKFGYQGGLAIDDQEDLIGDSQLTYTFANGQPTVVQHADRAVDGGEPHTVDGIYAQDQWTIGRATIQGALRYDRAWSWFPSRRTVRRQRPGSMPRRSSFPTTDGVTGYNDITPAVWGWRTTCLATARPR